MFDANNKEFVTPVGNAWILCRSTSHPGHIYYFNTATGNSTWNLSPEEMEKAQRNAKHVDYHTSRIAANCPEPKEPPTQLQMLTHKCCMCPTRESTKIFNKQVVYNKVSTPPGTLCTMCVSPTINVHHPVHYTSLNIAQNSLASEIQTESSIEPIKIEDDEPATTSGVNSLGNVVNQNFSTALNETTAVYKRRKEMPDYSVKKRISNCDLRHLLRNRKPLNRRLSVGIADDNQSQMQTDSDDESMNDSSQPETYDLSSLKQLAKCHSNQDRWFVVADINIFLYHIQFLNTILFSDKQCCLMVSKTTQMELKNPTNTLLRARMSYANYFISKLLDSGYAFIEEQSLEQKQILENKGDILNCCLMLNEKKYFVVLISNDIEVLKYKNTTNIPIFTVKGLEEFLCTSTQSITSQSSESSSFVSSRQIKITIPNEKSNLHKPKHGNQNNQSLLTQKDTGQQVENTTCKNPIVKTADAEVQTDLSVAQIEEMERVYKMASLTSAETKRINNEQNCEKNRSKHYKLRRGKLNQSKKASNQRNIESNEILGERNETSLTNNENVDIIILPKNSTNRQIDNVGNDTSIENRNIISIEKNNVNLDHSSTTQEMSNIVPKENIDDKNVMFEVTSPIMEDSLKIKCDEWVSRFVQIMEEGLSQVLSSNSSTCLPPPPWSMYEAAICIQDQFTNDTDVIDSSRKFLGTLSEISDTRGQINSDISPSKYMEMYSYGVYLIDSLQGIFHNSEDLQVAAESLAKLLNDIQDPQPDPSNLDTFTDSCQEEPVIRDEQLSINECSLATESLKKETSATHIMVDKVKSGDVSPEQNSSSPTEYNLTAQVELSREHGQYMQKSLPMVTFIRTDMEECLLPNLNPNKSEGQLSDDTSLPYDNIDHGGGESNNDNCNFDQTSVNLPISESNTTQEINSPSVPENVTNEPKIIRNFVKCITFEKRLQNRSQWNNIFNQLDDEDDENCLNYEDDSDSEENLNYREDYQEVDGDDDVEEDHYSGDMIRFDMDDFSGFQNNQRRSSMQVSNEENETVELDFKYIIKNIAKEINIMSTFVYSFCTNSYEKLSKDLTSTKNDKENIRETAEQAHLYINKLYTALDSTLHQNQGGSCNLRKLLKNTEFHNVSFDDDELKNYGKFVAKCLEQVKALKETVSAVVTAVND